MATRRGGHWLVGSITAIITAAISSVGAYYASGAGSNESDIKANEHRLTQLEDRVDGFDKMVGHLWCAIHVNHGEPCNQ